MRVAIFGAGGHAKVIWESLVAAGHEVVGFAADGAEPGRLLDLPVAGQLDALPAHDGVVVAIGHNRTRRDKFLAFRAQGRRLVNAIHPSAVLSRRLTLGEGIVIMAGVVVNVDTRIGDNAIINTGATLDHDNDIGAHVHVAPGCNLAGSVTLEEGAFLGIGTRAIPGIRVGAWATAGAGSVLVRDVEAGVTVVGVPARPRPAR